MRKPVVPPIAVVVAVPVALAAGFALAAGWIGPSRLGGAAITDAIEYNAGRHSGYRRAHAKGVCFAGRFEASGAGAGLSTASALRRGVYPVVGRFSVAGGDPLAKDGRLVFRSMAIAIHTPDGQEWRSAMDHTPIFPVATPEAFVAFQRASRPDPATGAPVPSVMKAYLARHPETRAFQAHMKSTPLPDSFVSSAFHSINAFRFVDAQRRVSFVRWTMAPEVAPTGLDKASLDRLPRDYLFQDLADRLRTGPARWRLVLTVANPGDVTDDATVRWGPRRRQVHAGVLVVERAEPESRGACRDLNFDPTQLPRGIAPSDDPLLAARSAAYSVSFARRAAEGAGRVSVGDRLERAYGE